MSVVCVFYTCSVVCMCIAYSLHMQIIILHNICMLFAHRKQTKMKCLMRNVLNM